MTESDQENNNYWLNLFNDEKVGPELWNRFLIYKYPEIVKPFIVDGVPNKLWSDISQMSQKEIDEIKELEERYGEPPNISNTQRIEPCMDFTELEFDSEISFGRRILMGADFRYTEFKKAVDFSESVFLGNTNFNKAKFLGSRPIKSIESSYVVSFDKSSFVREANFDAVQFPYRTSFEEARFNSLAKFRKAIFGKECRESGYTIAELVSRESGYTSFDKAIFKYDAYFFGAIFNVAVFFYNTQFNSNAHFDEAKFNSNAHFDEAIFNSNAHFDEAKFNELTIFKDTEFNNKAEFDATEFNNKAEFENTSFNKDSDFNNAKFRNTLSFSQASFSQPPKFFNTEFHEDMDFSGITWSKTEQFYSRNLQNKCDKKAINNRVKKFFRAFGQLARLMSKQKKDDKKAINKRAEEAIRVWDRLALIMSKQEKPAERHEFFRLKMRAQRKRDGLTFLTILNCLFEKLSDYGWGVGLAFMWWGLHICLGTIFLFLATFCQINGGGLVPYLKMFGNSLLVSFSNSVSFLGLGSKGGHLYELSMAANDAIAIQWVFPTVGTVQAVLGPILLFLVLLTLRNRFRIK